MPVDIVFEPSASSPSLPLSLSGRIQFLYLCVRALVRSSGDYKRRVAQILLSDQAMAFAIKIEIIVS